MADTDTGITDQTDQSVDLFRSYSRSVAAKTVLVQGVTTYAAGVLKRMALAGQVLGGTNGLSMTLPSSWTAKKDEQSGTSTGATQTYLLMRRPVPSDNEGSLAVVEGSVGTGTTILDRARFFSVEDWLEPVTIYGPIKFWANLNVKSSSTTACTLTGIKFQLRVLTDTDTYTDIGAACTKTLAAAISNSTNAYVTASAKTVYGFAEVASPVVVAAGQRLVLECTVYGTVGAGMTATVAINTAIGSFQTGVEFGVEEASV